VAIRSEQSRLAILQATIRLLDEREHGSMSVQQLSIERIAREAGVSKATIYRWWSSKAALIIDTFLENHITSTTIREDLPAIEALKEHAISLAQVYSGHEGALMAQLIAESQYDEATLADFKKSFFLPRREMINAVIRRAKEEGAIRDDLDINQVAEHIYSPIYFRLLFKEGSLDRDATGLSFDITMQGLKPS
jgi:AcrR family transcriptional regulator